MDQVLDSSRCPLEVGNSWNGTQLAICHLRFHTGGELDNPVPDINVGIVLSDTWVARRHPGDKVLPEVHREIGAQFCA